MDALRRGKSRLSWQSTVVIEQQSDNELQDTAYLSPIVDEIEAEMKEREDLDSMVVRRKKEEEAQKTRA